MQFGIVEDLAEHREKILSYMQSFPEDANDKYTFEDALNEGLEGNVIFWAVCEDTDIRGIAVTQVMEHPRAKELQIIICIGRGYKDWYNFAINILEDYAKSINCKKISAMARLGWERVMIGYKKTHVILEKNL